MMMIQKTRKTIGGICAAALLLASSAHAAELDTYWAERKGSKVTVAGDSTVHAWTVEADLIGGTMKLDSSFPLDGKTADVKVTPVVNVTIPVRNLKSGKEKMDNVMLQAMKQDDPKNKFIKYDPDQNDAHGKGKPMEYDTTGTLTVCRRHEDRSPCRSNSSRWKAARKSR